MLNPSSGVSERFSTVRTYWIVSPGVATVAGSSPLVTLIAYFSNVSCGVNVTAVCASS